MGKTFILGVGAPKCGTTWLSDYFAASKEIAFTPYKELHYFDAVLRPDLFSLFSRQKAENLAKIVTKVRARELVPSDYEFAVLDRVAMDLDPTAYLRHFDRIADGKSVVGEFSPTYAFMGAEALKEARNMITAGGYEVRVIFLMRDPLERIYSARRWFEGKGLFEDANEKMKIFNSDPEIPIRARYDWALRDIPTVFEENEIFFGFYENLFCDETINQICNFVGVDAHAPDFRQRSNPSAVIGKLPEELVSDGVKKMASIYQAVRQRFGDAVPAQWYA